MTSVHDTSYKQKFSDRVLAVVSSIRSGQTMTYKEVAKAAGSPRAYRAVGNILNKNYNPKIPCHRVVKSNNTTGGYNRGMDKKIELLKQEDAL